MTLYFFSLKERGHVLHDEEGADFASLTDVRTAAIRAARSVMSADVADGSLCLACEIRVTDDAGGVVLTLPFAEAVTLTGVTA